MERELIQNLDDFGVESEDNKIKILPDYEAESDFDNIAVKTGLSYI